MKHAIAVLLLCSPLFGYGQLGVGMHQSTLPFVTVNYEFFGHLRPELRIGTDRYFHNLSMEGVILYDLLNSEHYEWYAGAGVRVVDDYDNETELAIPVGFNFYPFELRNFGFHIELTPLVNGNSNDKLRGSWGIRYRFLGE